MTKSAACEKLRKRTKKNFKSYREPTSDSEDADSTALTLPPRRSLPARASRSFRNAYEELPSDDSSVTSDSEIRVPFSPRITRSRAPPSRKRKSPGSSEGDTSLFRQLKRQKSAQALPVRKQVYVNVPPPPSGNIPAWQTLPYHVLLNIMQHAAYPFYIGASRDTGTARWLLQTSELCRSFHEACIGALMYNPPLFPAHRAHHLIRLLSKSAEDSAVNSEVDREPAIMHKKTLSTDYRPKVKALDIEVKNVLIRKAGIDITDLVKHTPMLKHLRLYHNHDALAKNYVWAQRSHAKGGKSNSYTYDKLFKTLSSCPIQLHSFEFNGRFLADDSLLFGLRDACCESTALKSLRSLTLRNLDLPKIDDLNERVYSDRYVLNEEYPGTDIDAPAARLLTWRINMLKALAASSDLRHIAIHDANIIDDHTLADFPDGLESLTITNCGFIKSEGLHRWLQQKGSSLKKLVLCGNLCLNLDFMKDLADTAPHLQQLEIDLTFHDVTSFKDTEPLFDELLPDKPPTWPSALETISISPLRKVSVDDVEGFYQSLIDAAPVLPYLRVLQLRTILSQASWRERALLRQKWEAKIRGTFLSEAKTSTSRRSRRLVDTSSTEESEAELDYGNGQCHTVLFELSDQRPAQEQFTERDFLDSDPDEDDGEWNERDTASNRPPIGRRFAIR